MVVMEKSSIRVPLLLVSLIILGSNISPFLLLAECKGTKMDIAGQLAECLHDAFRKNAGIDYLHRLYDSLPCVHQDNNGKTLLENITKPAVDRLNSTMKFLQDLKKDLQQISSKFPRTNVSYCCQENAKSFDERVLSSVDLSQGCTISESYDVTDGDLTFNSEVLSMFQKNFNKSSLVSWQYYGSANGEYLQYPSNQRHCDGNSSKFDPRFKSWYVETASPVKKNIVIVIDRSLSMRREGKMELAKGAAITVLDTLSPQDNVGIVAFATKAKVPSGCFGSTVAVGIPTNLKILKDWVHGLVARGQTNYAPAFRMAFIMLHNVTKRQKISDRRSIILFLTDGDPTDVELDVGINREIQNGQAMMNHTVQINTYALGKYVSRMGLQRLQKISSNNRGVFREIKDQNRSALKRLMGSYYMSINSSYEQRPRLSLPFKNSRLGLMVTMSSAVIRNGFFTGVVAVDLPIQRLFPEILKLSSTPFVYALLIDREGRVILHPSLPGPNDVTSSRSFLPLSLFEPTLPIDVLQDITSGRSGKGIFQASFPLPLGNHPSDGARLLQTNATYMWSPVGENDYYIVCVVANDQSLKRDLKSCASSSPLSGSFYHRLDLSWNAVVSRPRDICRWKNTLLAPASSTVKIAPHAFRDRTEYIYSTETLKDLQGIQQFFNDHHLPPQKKYKGLSEAVREEVQLTLKLEEIWKREETLNPNLIKWRFVGTHKGVLRVFPGTRFQKTYSHKRQAWFMKAISSPTKLIISPTNSAYQQNTTMVSLSKAVRKIRCNKRGMEVLAVLGIEMTESAFLKIINDKVGLYDDSTMDWYLVDSSGYVLFNLSSRETQVEKKHLTSVFPWLANELIRRDGTLKVSWCNNYQQRSVQLFYEMLDFTKNSSNSSFPCRQFTMNKVRGTTLFLLGLPPRSVHQCTESPLPPQEGCSCSNVCIACSGDASLTCQCPCECHMLYDECYNSVTRLWTSTPCPLPPSPLHDTDMDQAIFESALSSVRKCSRDCLTILNRTECEKTTDCYWCSNAAIPSCNSECRTNQSLSMVALFPCNDLVNLTADQQASFKVIFIEKLRQLVRTLTSQSLEILKLKKGTIAFKLHATTLRSDLDSTKRNIQRVVKEGKVVFGPTVDLSDIFTARSSKQYTNLIITLGMEKRLPQRPQDIKSALQSILERILGKSVVSLIRQFSVKKASVKFSLSNEGYIHLYPLEPFKDRLEKAVKSREISFQVPAKDAVNKTTAVNMSAIKTFDSLCRTTTPSEASITYSTPSQKITTYFTSSQKGTTYLTASPNKGTTYFTASPNKGTTYLTASQKKGTTHFTASQKGTTYFTRTRQSAMPKRTSSSTTGKPSIVTPTEKERDIKQGLTPIEICVIATVSVVGALAGALALFCLFFLLKARKRRPRSTSQVSPETDDPAENRSVISEIPEIDTNLNIVVNRAYFVHEELKTYRSTHVDTSERDIELTSPKHITQGAWF